MVGLPIDRLKSWSKPGLNQNSKDTYAKIKQLIENNISNPVDVYLQGSYANKTNVIDNSDIDVIVELKNIATNQDNFNSYESYKTLIGFRDDIYKAINNKNGFIFYKSDKTIKYKGNGVNFVSVDIIPCIGYKRTKSKNKGIVLLDNKENRAIINYPKKHIGNGNKKSGRTGGNYKEAIRMFKNAKNYLIKSRKMNKGIASSYFIECLLYNVPDKYYKGSPFDVFYGVLYYLYTNIDKMENKPCQNGIIDLFGNGYTQWNIEDAKHFIKALSKMSELRRIYD